jgi:hypothetical protein
MDLHDGTKGKRTPMKAPSARKRRYRRSLCLFRCPSAGATIPERFEAGDDEPCELIGPGLERSGEG